jgi:hypothetical protein
MRFTLFPAIGAAAVAFFASSLSAQTVTLSLTSPQSGNSVTPGSVIQWSIGFTVSSGGNAGLALLVVDLVQDGANPVAIDIPPADGVPAGLANFSRPAGISNPGEDDPVTGYVGVQRGVAGSMNLRQIGGAQNTFGQAMAAGSGFAESAVVAGGIGQGGTVTLASGSFAAPGEPGTYIYQLENPVANVLSAVHPATQISPVSGAAVIFSAASFSFTVSDEACEACDANCDGARDGLDIQAFVAALLLPSAGRCSPCAGDMNGGGDVSQADVAQFVACLLGS